MLLGHTGGEKRRQLGLIKTHRFKHGCPVGRGACCTPRARSRSIKNMSTANIVGGRLQNFANNTARNRHRGWPGLPQEDPLRMRVAPVHKFVDAVHCCRIGPLTALAGCVDECRGVLADRRCRRCWRGRCRRRARRVGGLARPEGSLLVPSSCRGQLSADPHGTQGTLTTMPGDCDKPTKYSDCTRCWPPLRN